MIGFGGIIYNGILDKFPNIRIGFMEGGAAWLALVLERFDRGHETHRQVDPRGDLQGPHPDEKASDYIIRHIKAGRLYVGCEGHEPALAYLTKTVGNEAFVYSSDFPHEVNNEMCRHEIGELIDSDELTRADKEAILAGNAERFHRLAYISQFELSSLPRRSGDASAGAGSGETVTSTLAEDVRELGRSEACYADELRASLVELTIWPTLHSPTGKPEPKIDYEDGLNVELAAVQRNPERYPADVREWYAALCEQMT
jgi:hypothetical protein